MTPFLKQIALHYLAEPDIEKTIFIFPNRRSMAFFRKYMEEGYTASAPDVPMLEPEMLTINDFFSKVTGKRASDRISLLIELYECYSALNKKAESLDDFIYWGDVLCSDFDDTDKYLIKAESLFTNISELKDIKDDFSYLEQRQIEAIEKLSGHFRPDSWKKKGVKDVKGNFLMIWNILLPLYNSFRQRLKDKGMAYEGMVYRELAERLESESATDVLSTAFGKGRKYVFAGLNALNECERRTLRKMDDAGIAEFCWDCPGDMIKDRANKASHFMLEGDNANLSLFKPAFEATDRDSEDKPLPAIHVISVPSATGQAKLLPEILSSVPEDESGLDFAIVLPDETMLMTVLNSIPEEVESINVTMGYPLSSSEFFALMRDIVSLQLHIRNKDGICYFYHKQVSSILSSGIINNILTQEEKTMVENIRKNMKFYIPSSEFGLTGILGSIFKAVALNQDSPDSEQISKLSDYLLGITASIVGLLPEDEALQAEFARQYYCCINRLKDKGLAILPRTWAHLLEQLCAGQSIPFEGDPLGGLQIMGPLETRALDFKHLVILNSNESVFPRKSISSSFIPPELRKAFDLPTYEYQDSVWAYYFYRMIARAENVWMISDSRTEGLKSGEESRYIKQLKYLYPDKCSMDFSIAMASACPPDEEEDIPKTEDDVKVIENTALSASSLHKYISCPASFYYYVVRGLYAEDEVTDKLDAGMLGDVCHDTLEALYCSEDAVKSTEVFDKRFNRWKNKDHLEFISKEYLSSWLGRKDEIMEKIKTLICQKTKTIEVSGRNLIDAEVALHYVCKVIERDIELISQHGPVRILGLEQPYSKTICGQRFKGYIDRLDTFEDGTVRIVDYKTGRDNPDSLVPPEKVEEFSKKLLDGTSKVSSEDKAALQFFIYSKLIEDEKEFLGKKRLWSMYAMSSIFTKPVGIVEESCAFKTATEENLNELLAEIKDTGKGFARTKDENKCRWCDYRTLCGRTDKQQ